MTRNSKAPAYQEAVAKPFRKTIAAGSGGIMLCGMGDVTQILTAIEAGDPNSTSDLLPLVYEELRGLAAARLALERPGQTLDATGLVHEAFLRLVGANTDRHWNGRRHFFAAAAEAMRRILVEQARRKRADKRGGQGQRFELSQSDRIVIPDPDTVLAVDEAIEQLAGEDPDAAAVARLRLFAGLSIEESAETLGVSRATAFRDWAYARAVLIAALDGDGISQKP